MTTILSKARRTCTLLIVRADYSNTPAAASRPASRHDDLMLIVEAGAARAEYFDSEGHVIHYAVVATTEAVVFVSNVNASPRYRLTYRRGSETGTLDGTFEAAAPGKPDAFAACLSWRARKAK